MDRLSEFEKNRITQNKIDIYIVDNKTKLIQTTGGLQVGQIDFPELQSLSTQSHCPSVICYTSAPLILLHLIEHFKKARQSTFVIRLWVFCARYWQRSMKECRQFCHFFKHQTALFHIWRMPLFSSFLKALDKTNTLRPFDRWEIESERRASLEPTFPISGWS